MLSNGNIKICLLADNLKNFCLFLKYCSVFQCAVCIDIFAMDLSLVTFLEKFRFLLFYEVLSLYNNMRFKIQVLLQENSSLESLFLIYNSVEWAEREV